MRHRAAVTRTGDGPRSAFSARRRTEGASLANTLSRAVALGDEEAARVVHEAKGRLLGLPVAPEG
ncbi:hypothetical protein [Sorangium sp. So ce1099]|uniref:hypothetical protein n=1 Tax=Sorangium sp. So ce1099 TaxID=3133331 RepID=UPI003F63DAF8